MIIIIKFPTALYYNQIPHEPSDGGDVTYVISTTSPPRVLPVITTQIPSAIETLQREFVELTEVQRRQSFGEFIYSVTKSSGTEVRSNKKQFEVGQLLEFVDKQQESSVQSTPSSASIQHNTNLLDLGGIGLSLEDIEILESTALGSYASLIKQLNEYKTDHASTIVAIANNQKDVNEVQKALAAIDGIQSDNLTDIRSQLVEKQNELNSERTTLITEADELLAQINLTMDNIIKVSQVVR